MRKKSITKAVSDFKNQVDDIIGFVNHKNMAHLSTAHVSWAHDYAIIRLYREFEKLTLGCLVAAINRDSGQLSSATGVAFPTHLRNEVCEYIIVRNGYFDFHGRGGLIGKIKEFLPKEHYLVKIIKKHKYMDTLNQLTAFRNFATHGSTISKKGALEAINGSNLSSAGAWLKTNDRFGKIARDLKALADDVCKEAQ